MLDSFEQWLPALAMYIAGSIVPAVVIALGASVHALLQRAPRPPEPARIPATARGMTAAS